MASKLAMLFMTIGLPILEANIVDSDPLFPEANFPSMDFVVEKSHEDNTDRNTGSRGPRGRRGPQGRTGNPGNPGSQGNLGTPGTLGITGPIGPAGISTSSGSLIPFSSGSTVFLSSTGTESVFGAIVAFGRNVSDVPITGSITDSQFFNLAFSVSGNYILTDIAANFTLTGEVSLPLTPVQISAQIYISTAPNNTFSPLPQATVNFPTINAATPSGEVLEASVANLSIPIPANSRLLLVFYETTSFDEGITNVLGYASAGIRLR